jgi:hypothetical protein
MTDIETIRAAVAGGWCVPPNTAKEMDVDLGEAIVQALVPVVAAARAEVMREAAPVAASLAAAISLLERGGKSAKKAAASDKMFDQMLADYRKSLADFRAVYAEASK